MSRLRWITSLGGPMICMEKDLAASWGGIEALSVPSRTAANDYERAAEPFGYVQPLPLKQGAALVFGEGPLETSFWRSGEKKLYIVQVVKCDENCELEDLLSTFTRGLSAPEETLQMSFSSSPLVLFDSVEIGTAVEAYLTTELRPGSYLIDTYVFEEADRCCRCRRRSSKTT